MVDVASTNKTSSSIRDLAAAISQKSLSVLAVHFQIFLVRAIGAQEEKASSNLIPPDQWLLLKGCVRL